MASTTSNLGLTKPAVNEGYSLDVWNGNMQKLEDKLGMLPRVIQTAAGVSEFQVEQNRNNWICGLLICNTDGGGNGVYYIDVMDQGTFGVTTIAKNSGNNTVIGGSFSGNKLILTATLNGTRLVFYRATWIGLSK